MIRLYRQRPPRPQAVTEGPAVAPGADPLTIARKVARWAGTLPEVNRARVSKGYGGDDAPVRVYLDWVGGYAWNRRYVSPRPELNAHSYVVLRPGPVAFVHRDPPDDPPRRRAASVAAIERWAARARAAL